MNGVKLDRGRDAEPVAPDRGYTAFVPAAVPFVAGFYTLDLVSWEVDCDPHTFRLHGLDPDDPDLEPRLESFLRRVPGEDLPALLAAISDLSKECGDYRVEYRVTGGDGTVRAMEARGRVLAGPDGSPARMVGLVTDTSEYRAQRDTEHEFATRLQSRMLPAQLRPPPGVAAAARYSPATSGMLIGGDWYDIVRQPDGSAVLVIGDVQGHSIEAACVMGQLRAGLRAYLSEGHTPARALAMANRMLAGDAPVGEEPLFASCCLVALRPGSREAEVCCAGHLPPLAAAAATGAWAMRAPAGLLLGVDREMLYESVVVPLPEDATLLLCTDGLLEAGSGDLDAGIDRVLPVLAAGTALGLEELADAVLATAGPQSFRTDDVALLMVRGGPEPVDLGG